MRKPTKSSFRWRNVTESRLFFPLVALVLILFFDLLFIPGFFAIEVRDGNLHGSLIDIFRNGSTVMLLAIGMTLVIATGGVDLSVGATMAIAASVAGILMNPSALRNEVNWGGNRRKNSGIKTIVQSRAAAEAELPMDSDFKDF